MRFFRLLFTGLAFLWPISWPGHSAAQTSIRQVQIQAWIGETTEQGLRDIGANLDYTRFVRGQERAGSVERVTTQVFDPLNPEFTVTLPAPDLNPPRDNLRPDQSGSLADGIQTQSGAGMTFSIIDAGRGTLDAVIRGLERKADIDLMSKPELLVVDGGEAEIHAGGQVPFQNISWKQGRPQLDVAWEKIGVNMKIQPTVLDDDLVRINLMELNVKDIARIDKVRGIDLPVFSERSQTGVVVVPDGQAIVIGGLTSRVVVKSERRVPVIGSLPLLGIPFRGRRSEAIFTNLVVFVRPTIVDLRNLTDEAVDALNFWQQKRAVDPSQQWKNTERIRQQIQELQDEL